MTPIAEKAQHELHHFWSLTAVTARTVLKSNDSGAALFSPFPNTNNLITGSDAAAEEVIVSGCLNIFPERSPYFFGSIYD